jgi:hypothetical protein
MIKYVIVHEGNGEPVWPIKIYDTCEEAEQDPRFIASRKPNSWEWFWIRYLHDNKEEDRKIIEEGTKNR